MDEKKSENTAVVQQKPETQEQKLTLAQKIARLTTAFALPSPAPTPTKKEIYLPINPHETKENQMTFCEICGSPRIYPDPTGVTCGNSQCLLELGKQWKEKEETKELINNVVNTLKEVAAMLEIDNEALPDDAEEICNKIKEKVEPMDSALQHLKEVAQNLGLDEPDIGDTTEDIGDQIEEIINNLRIELISAAESLGLTPNDLPKNIEELCKVIAKESSAAKEALENLE